MSGRQATETDAGPGFSEQFAAQEPEPCAKCNAKGEFHWPLLADHKPIHDCARCPDCLHDGNKCCGCYDGACCKTRSISPEEGVTP